ncbi:receptor-interacting serine/threonine-protein kinase 2-like isoform X2 [Rhinoderma darwinii]
MKERDMMSRANYTYVLRLLGLYEIEGRTTCKYGLVMEYMPYGSVYTLFDRIKNVPWALKFQILHQVAMGMNYLHHVLMPPIIHRDLKPQNVLLSKSLDVQLTDFGLAKNETSVSLSRSMAGTVSYMPPEALISPNYKPTKEFDVYSFAILTWWVLSGQEPYKDVNGEMVMLIFQQNQNQRPEMNLVNQWINQKMVSEAIRLMQECWDVVPGKRPIFSAIIKRTNEMNVAYSGEINNDILKVLDQLKEHIMSQSQISGNPDGGIGLNPMPSNSDNSNTLNIRNFIKLLQQTKSEEIHSRTVNPETSSQDIKDAADFLILNLPKIVQAKPDLSEVLDALFSKRIIIQEELDMIKIGTIQDQIRKTLRTILNKGQESCTEFLRLMNHHHAELMTSLKEDII